MRLRAIADTVGATGAVICAIHCFAGPVLLLTGTILPAVSFGDETFHRAMLWLVIPAGVVAIGLGCRRHKDLLTAALGIAGIAGLVLAATALHGLLGEGGERAVTLVSAGALALGHLRNFRLCRAADCDHGGAAGPRGCGAVGRDLTTDSSRR